MFCLDFIRIKALGWHFSQIIVSEILILIKHFVRNDVIAVEILYPCDFTSYSKKILIENKIKVL